jgi:hypothetical protein
MVVSEVKVLAVIPAHAGPTLIHTAHLPDGCAAACHSCVTHYAAGPGSDQNLA